MVNDERAAARQRDKVLMYEREMTAFERPGE